MGAEEGPLAEETFAPRGTAVNVSVAALIAVAVAALFFLLLHLPGLRDSYLGQVLCERSKVQYVTATCFFWGLTMLVLKAWRIRVEQRPFSEDVLPVEAGQLIRQEDASHYIRRLKRLSREQRSRLLTSRVWRSLVRFRLLGSAEKVDDLLRYQADIDATRMESTYAFPKFLIAIVPILGFLGTVLGISEAVNGFSKVVNAAQDLESVKAALSTVTIGLATAFDTTLVALVLSAILMFGVTVFQRAEEALLGRIEEYCLDKLLDRLWVPPAHELFEEAVARSMASLTERIAEELRRPSRPGENAP